MRRDNTNDRKKEIRAKAEDGISSNFGMILFRHFVRAWDAGDKNAANEVREKAKSLYLYKVASFMNQYSDQ